MARRIIATTVGDFMTDNAFDRFKENPALIIKLREK
jgi:hypothetical protein